MRALRGIHRGRRFLRSVRTRLALWHTAVLALVLVAFTVATFTFLDGITHERIDRSLAEAVRQFHRAVLAEANAGRTPEQAVQDAARLFRFNARRVLVYGSHRSHHSLVAVSDSARDDLTQAISAIDAADDSPIHPLFGTLTPYEQWVDRLHAMTRTPEWKALLAQNGLTPFFKGGAEFEKFVVEQTAAYRTVAKQIGIAP